MNVVWYIHFGTNNPDEIPQWELDRIAKLVQQGITSGEMIECPVE